MIWPLKNPVITQLFGANPGYYDQFGYPAHNGLDLWTAESPPFVHAVDPGWVEKVGWEAGGYGKYVVVLHEGYWGEYRGYYAHLDSVSVKPGQALKTGSTIGQMGSTGFSSDPHLHFGIRLTDYKNNLFRGFLDPLPLLRGAAPPSPSEPPPTGERPTGREGRGGWIGKVKLPAVKLIGTFGKRTIYRMKRFF